MNTLASILNLRAGEGKLVTLMLAYAFLIGVANILTETAASALFLADHGAAYLPIIYIATAIVTPVSGYLYLKFEQRFSFATLLRLNLLFLASALLLFWLALLLARRSLTPALAVWSETSWDLAELGVWSMASRLFNLRQSKRLFSLISAGLIVSEAVSGFSTPLLVGWIGTSNLLLIAVGAFVGSAIFQSMLNRLYPTQLAGASEEEEEEATELNLRSIGNLFQIRYILLIFAIIFAYSFAHDFLGNAFYFEVEQRYATEAQIAGFIGIFSGMTGLIGALLGFLASGRLINRYGLRFGLLALPVALLLCALAIVASGTFLPGIGLFFGLIVLARFLDSTLDDSTNAAALQILYQPLPAKQRVRTQGAVSMIKPLTGGVVGIVLLILNVQLGFGTLQLVQALLFLLIIWIIVAWLASQKFPQMLMSALAKRQVEQLSTLTIDGTTLEVVRSALNNPRPEAVIYCLNLLQLAAPASVITYLDTLLDHPDPAVRHEVLRRVETLGSSTLIPKLRQALAKETNDELKGAYIRALAVLGDPDLLADWESYLENPSPAINLGLLVGLLRSGEIEGIAIAANRMLELVNSPVAAERMFAAQILGESGIVGFYRALRKLLYDSDLQVRSAAVAATSNIGSPQLWPDLVALLAFPRLRAKAASALTVGPAVLPALTEGFAQYQEVPEVYKRLAQICGRVGGPQAIRLLKQQLPIATSETRMALLAALCKCNYQAAIEERITIRHGLAQEIAETVKTIAAMANLAALQLPATPKAHEALALLQNALQDNLLQQRERLLYWLSFLYDSQMMKQVQTVLSGYVGVAGEEKRAYALEIIDLLIDSDLKPQLLPLLDTITPMQALRQIGAHLSTPSLSPVEEIAELIMGSNRAVTPWLRSCAIHVGMYISVETLIPLMVSSLHASAPLVRETALWALTRIAPDQMEIARELLAQEREPTVLRMLGEAR